MRETISLEEIKRHVSFDPETGIFTRLVATERTLPGTRADVSQDNGYRRVVILENFYLAHRLAWRMTYGAWPVGMVDHINGCRDDNRIENLRDATQTLNNANARRRSDNKTGVKGVCLSKGKYRATISKAGRQFNLGRFATIEAAALAYAEAARVLFGEFARPLDGT